MGVRVPLFGLLFTSRPFSSGKRRERLPSSQSEESSSPFESEFESFSSDFDSVRVLFEGERFERPFTSSLFDWSSTQFESLRFLRLEFDSVRVSFEGVRVSFEGRSTSLRD